MTHINTDQLKRSVDILQVLGPVPTLQHETKAELSGPCPRCGGDDRFHVHTAENWFFCRKCHPKRGDAIELVRFLGLAHSYGDARAYLGGPMQSITPKNQPVTETLRSMSPSISPTMEPTWRAPDWQLKARQLLEKSQEALNGPDGEPGRNYLLSRKIEPWTWQEWGLGYAHVWDGKQKRKRPAIVFPWQRAKITALQYRYIDAVEKNDRFSQLAGGQRIAFGLQNCGEHFVTLWLVEGETNCVSLSQCLRSANMVNFDVLSYGSQNNLEQNSAIVDYAKQYRQVIIWADERGVVESGERAIPHAFGLRSLLREGIKLDANSLLQHAALLPFVRRVWEEFDNDPAYIARCRAEFEQAE